MKCWKCQGFGYYYQQVMQYYYQQVMQYGQDTIIAVKCEVCKPND